MVELTGTRYFGCPHSALAAVSVLSLVAVLVGILIGILVAVPVILIGILVLVLVLVIHVSYPPKSVLRFFRYTSLPGFSGFIPGFENQAGGKTG